MDMATIELYIPKENAVVTKELTLSETQRKSLGFKPAGHNFWKFLGMNVQPAHCFEARPHSPMSQDRAVSQCHSAGSVFSEEGSSYKVKCARRSSRWPLPVFLFSPVSSQSPRPLETVQRFALACHTACQLIGFSLDWFLVKKEPNLGID